MRKQPQVEIIPWASEKLEDFSLNICESMWLGYPHGWVLPPCSSTDCRECFITNFCLFQAKATLENAGTYIIFEINVLLMNDTASGDSGAKLQL